MKLQYIDFSENSPLASSSLPERRLCSRPIRSLSLPAAALFCELGKSERFESNGKCGARIRASRRAHCGARPTHVIKLFGDLNAHYVPKHF